ncbi:MAG: DUF3301 domain-containing protein [Candidatus Dactylopiibacterium sp.]|nr:DUF3301 domain-containing protein [Candidatus Dactylopiibacterium sp.]
MTGSLIALLLLGAIAWYWADSLRAREHAVAAARTACRREDLQFLDDTVAQRGLRCVRNAAGRVVLQRSFSFEFSVSGDDRHAGLVILQGSELVLLRTRAPEVLH